MKLLSRFTRPKTHVEVSFPLILKEVAEAEGSYSVWIQNHRWNKKVEAWCLAQVKNFTYSPAVGILMQCSNPRKEFLRESLSSIFNQISPFSELSIVDRGSNDPAVQALLKQIEGDSRVKISYQKGSARDIEAIARIMKKAQSEWLLLMGAEDILEPNTLYNMVATLQDTVEIDFVFSDSDLLDDAGRRLDPQFKPIWAVGASYPLGYYQHPVLLSRRLVEKLKGYERVSLLVEEGHLLDEASNHSRYVLKAPGILYHARKRGLRNEKPPDPVNNVLMNEDLKALNGRIEIDTLSRQRAEPKVPLRILWLIDSLQRDDGETLLFHYVRYLAEQSAHQFSVVCKKDGPMRANYERLGTVHIISDEQDAGSFIRSIHAESPFAVAVTATLREDWLSLQLLEEFSIPIVSLPGSAASIANAAETFTSAATVIFFSASVEKEHKHLDAMNVSRVVPWGIDLAGIKTFKQQNSPFELRAKWNIHSSSTLFLIAGPTIERKRQRTFVEAALKVLSRNPKKEVDFMIAGARPGDYLTELQQLIEESGRQERFHLFDESNDPTQYYPYYLIADVCVSCSEAEPFPLSTLEAMAMKKAVIGTDVFGSNEVIQNDENGFLTTPRDVSELAQRFQFFIEQPEFCDFFGRSSLEIVYEKF
ncbi:MAG TPA: glycosyltransferase, partial [Acidobacteriota bacterium]|nr:glycosyltransferase [Acidobacteriota bacterium]